MQYLPQRYVLVMNQDVKKRKKYFNISIAYMFCNRRVPSLKNNKIITAIGL